MGSHRVPPSSSTPITVAEVEAGPVPAVDGVVLGGASLARWLLETFAISLDETTVGRELKALGFAKISARPPHLRKTSWPSGF